MKDQMAGEFPERNIVKLTHPATGAEEEAYRRLVESQFRDDDDEDSRSNKGRLFKITLEKRCSPVQWHVSAWWLTA